MGQGRQNRDGWREPVRSMQLDRAFWVARPIILANLPCRSNPTALNHLVFTLDTEADRPNLSQRLDHCGTLSKVTSNEMLLLLISIHIYFLFSQICASFAFSSWASYSMVCVAFRAV